MTDPNLGRVVAIGYSREVSDFDYDQVVIGSGFGGSVAALRLAQKGYDVLVLEAGPRFDKEKLPQTSWETRRYFWAPGLGCTGPQRVDFLRHAAVLSGVGVGGGSVVYGNTLYFPLDSFFNAPVVQAMGGREALAPYFDLAERMMGVVPNAIITDTDRLAEEIAKDLGRGETFGPSPVGVFFGDGPAHDESVPDPYFHGEGPARTACNGCGGCNLGCPRGSKNTLDLNYLHLAEGLGAQVLPETAVRRIVPLSADGAAGYQLHLRALRPPEGEPRDRCIRTRGVIVSGGVLGTLRLLLESRDRGDLPRLSPRLGHSVRTNSETIVAVRDRDRSADRSYGVAASTSLWVDDHTQVQLDRQSPGSDSMALLMTLLVDGGGALPRPLRWLGAVLRRPLDLLRHLDVRGFARQTAMLVVMQDLDSSLIISRRRRWWAPWSWKLATRPGPEGAAPSWIPQGNSFARRLAHKMGGIALGSVTEMFLGMPVTAHILGGCVVARSPEEGVVDHEHRVFGYENLRICDGSVVPTNLAVNPVLTILALAERAMAKIPPKGGDRKAFRPLAADRAWGTEERLLRD